MTIVVNDLQYLLDSYISRTKVPSLSIDKLREIFFEEFESNDRKRGIPYLTPTRTAAADYINYIDDLELEDGEEPYVGNSLAGLLDDGLFSHLDENKVPVIKKRKVVRKVVRRVVKQSAQQPPHKSQGTAKVTTDKPKKVVVENQKDFEYVDVTARTSKAIQEKSSVAKDFKKRKPVDKPKRPAEKPNSITKKASNSVTVDIDDLLDNLFASVSDKPTPSRVSNKVYLTVRDAVLDNNGCTYDFVLKHFTQKQLTKEIDLGKVYIKNGRLYA